MAYPLLGLPLWMWLFASVVVVSLAALSARPRPLAVERLWIGPALVAAATALPLAMQGPARAMLLAVYLLSAAAGGAVGWWISRHTEVRHDARRRRLVAQLTPFGLMIVLAVIAARIGVREALVERAAALQVTAAEVANAFLLMAVGLVVARAAGLWRRGRRLLAEPPLEIAA